MIQILDPTNPKTIKESSAPSIGDLQGKVIGILNNHWTTMDAIADRKQNQLKEKYGVAGINRYDIPVASEASTEVLEKAVAECDAAIVGLAN